MKNYILCLFSLLGLSVFGQTSKPLHLKTIPEKADSLLALTNDFSGVILLADKGKPVYHKAFGYRNITTKSRLETKDIFELASISKQFTAMLVMMLNEEKKLDYDDGIDKYLPALPYQGITIRNLLNHTSGLPDYQAVMDEHWDKTKVAGNADILEYLKKYHPAKLFEPGEKYLYSNTGYVLLGSIIEKASGKDFIALCRERIFTPVAMTSTDIRSNQEKAKLSNFASGSIYVTEKGRYAPADSFPSSNYVFWLGARKGPGRITSTTTDLLKWDRALYANKLIKQATLEQAFTPAKLTNDSLSNYGFGWMLRPVTPYGKVVYHTGSNPGYKNIIIRYIDRDKTIIILCNNANAKLEKITEGLEVILNDAIRH